MALRWNGVMKRAGILAIILTGLSFAEAGGGKQAKVEKRAFGKTSDGTAIDLYVLTNANGMQARVMTYGAILTSLTAPDKDGKFENVVLGFDDLKGYLDGHPYFGATV